MSWRYNVNVWRSCDDAWTGRTGGQMVGTWRQKCQNLTFESFETWNWFSQFKAMNSFELIESRWNPPEIYELLGNFPCGLVGKKPSRQVTGELNSIQALGQLCQFGHWKMWNCNMGQNWSQVTTLWLCQNSYGKWPLIVDFPIKNGDFQ